MEFEFNRDIIGEPTAHLSMEHELIAHWLMDELGSGQKVALSALIEQFLQLQQGRAWEFSHQSLFYTVQATRDEVVLCANTALCEQGAELIDLEELSLFNAADACACGLDDLLELLLSWQAYLCEG